MSTDEQEPFLNITIRSSPAEPDKKPVAQTLGVRGRKEAIPEGLANGDYGDYELPDSLEKVLNNYRDESVQRRRKERLLMCMFIILLLLSVAILATCIALNKSYFIHLVYKILPGHAVF